MWVVRMKTYLQTYDSWDAIEYDHDPQPLVADPTFAQIRNHHEKKTKKYKAKTYHFSIVSETIFLRIIAFEIVEKIWDYLKEEFEGMIEQSKCKS